MKYLLGFIVSFSVLAGLLVFAVGEDAAPHRAQVRGFISDRIDGGASGIADDAFAAIRGVVDGDERDPDDATLPSSGDEAPSDTGSSMVSESLALYEIGSTSGIGVSLRSSCADDARVDGGLAEGEAIAIVERGADGCAGWTLIESEVSGAQTWVRDQFLVARTADGTPPPLFAAPAPPTAIASPSVTTPSASPSPTPSPTAVATAVAAPSATWFGRLRGEPGDSVSAWIRGVECASSTAYDKDGSAFYYVAVSSDVPCGPTEGAHVEFRVNGSVAPATGVWHAGGSVQLSLGTN